MQATKKQQILKLFKRKPILRPRDLDEFDISREYLNKLFIEGILDRPARGLYVLKGAEPSEHRTIVEACKRVPNGVVCLLTALRMHDLTTQSPFEIWVAIEEKAWRPKIDDLPLRIIRLSGQSLTFGIEHRTIEGVKVSVYSPAKTMKSGKRRKSAACPTSCDRIWIQCNDQESSNEYRSIGS